jgi:hypothetical protein
MLRSAMASDDAKIMGQLDEIIRRHEHRFDSRETIAVRPAAARARGRADWGRP